MSKTILLAVYKSVAGTFSASSIVHVTNHCFKDKTEVSKQDVYEYVGSGEILSYSPLFDNNQMISL